MYSVWQEKEKLQREVANLELQLKMKTKIAELDKQIQLQVWRIHHLLSLLVHEWLRAGFSMNVETLVETNLAIVLPGVFAPLLATDDKREQVFPRLRPATCVWFKFSLVLWIACLSVIGQSEKALFRSNEKSSNFHFFLVYMMCNFLSLVSFSHSHLKVQFLNILIQLLFNLWRTWNFRHSSFKKLFILIRTLCSLTSKGSFP